MAMVVAVRPPLAEVLNDQRTEWVRRYRQDNASADAWATGLRHVSHSVETQERVFRMAEQLARRGADRTDLFTALEEADRCVALSDGSQGAADAGHRVMSSLVSLQPESVVICSAEKPATLRALGFEPLGFDGYDPAAYAWVMFELSMRAEADRQSQWRRCIPAALATPMAIGLASL